MADWLYFFGLAMLVGGFGWFLTRSLSGWPVAYGLRGLVVGVAGVVVLLLASLT